MALTSAQTEAAERDGPWCVWSAWRLGALVPATDRHHLARRQPGADRPELIISLSHAVHMAHHNGREPTTAQLLDLMAEAYGLDLRHDFPQFFAHR